MASQERFTLLRKILSALGLSAEAVDDIINRVTDWLFEKEAKPEVAQQYPYACRDDFLSLAEQSFYLVLKSTVSYWAIVCPKVSLSDVFFVKSKDPSQFRIYTNKIDRKHVDFLLCDPKTVRPLAGIELDDKSHQRADRQERDEFVEGVFHAAKVPLVRVNVKHAYSTVELDNLLREVVHQGVPPPALKPTVESTSESPDCPKCGSKMVLRIAKSGTNVGKQFWGCTHYPQCRGLLPYQVPLDK